MGPSTMRLNVAELVALQSPGSVLPSIVQSTMRRPASGTTTSDDVFTVQEVADNRRIAPAPSPIRLSPDA
jgi:hypothetical protein